MQIKLIDFNVATFLSNMGNIFNLYGNKTFSAPELFSGSVPNLLSDIYSIGKVMEYISKYLDEPLNPKIHQIIKKATFADPTYRFETVDKLASAIQNEKENLHQSQSRKKIAVLGSHTGCGATHISMALVSVLNYLGYDSIYYERDSKNNLRSAQEFNSNFKERDALLFYKYFKGFPNYGPGIVLPKTDELFSVYDYGISQPAELDEFDVILIVCSNSFWHWHENLQKARTFMDRKDQVKLVCNMGQKETLHWLANQLLFPVFHFPNDICLFSANHSKIEFATKLLNIKRRKQPFFHLKNLFYRKKS